MVNQQLRDYVNQQLQLGVAREVLKTTLLESGWAEGDVKDVMGDPVAQAPTAIPGSPVMITRDVLAGVKSAPQAAQPANVFPARTAPGASIPRTPEVKPAAATAVRAGERRSNATVLFGIAAIVLVGLAGWLFKLKTDADYEVRRLTAENGALSTKLSNAEVDLRNTQEQVKSTQGELRDLASQLSLFVLMPGSTSTELLVTIRGTLSGDRGLYTVTTKEGVAVTVKNGREAKVEALLKPLVNGLAEITGTHLPNSREVTVTAVNGTAIE